MYLDLNSDDLRDLLDRVPTPTGYRILVMLAPVQQKTAGGIIIPDNTRDRESVASIVARVIALGPDAYKDPEKFPTGAWCKDGDLIIINSYAGRRFLVDGIENEFRLINDDTPEAIVKDPKVIKRA